MSDYYPNGRPLWDDQFREMPWERQERWRATRARRKAEGKCWQCAKLFADCACPNVSHAVAKPIAHPSPSNPDRNTLP